jgi:hypothetical protein
MEFSGGTDGPQAGPDGPLKRRVRRQGGQLTIHVFHGALRTRRP